MSENPYGQGPHGQQPQGHQQYGQHQPPQGQWQPAYPPAPPVKKQNWFMRHKILTGLLALVVVGIIGGALGGGGDAPSTATTDPTTTSAPTTANSPAAASSPSKSTAAAPKPTTPPEPQVDPDDVGNEANPVTIVEGKAFDIRKFSYAPGWKVTSNDFGMSLDNLKVTNNRDDRDGAFVQIKYMKGSEVLATIDCSSDQILPGQTVTLSCFSTEKKPKGFDRVTINDTF